jgi:hypothetical protein
VSGDDLIISVRQPNAEPEDGGITRKHLAWFRVSTVEHFRDCLEFYSESLGSFGALKVLQTTGETYAIGTPSFRKKWGLAGKYQFLNIRPKNWDKIYPERLRIDAPVWTKRGSK